MNKSIKKIVNINKGLIIVVVVIITIALLQKLFYESQPQIFVVGKLIDTEVPMRGDVVLVYKYKYNNNKYEGRQGKNNISYEINARYFVRIPEGYPSKGLLMLDKPVPDSIKSAPPEGWKELPIKFEE